LASTSHTPGSSWYVPSHARHAAASGRISSGSASGMARSCQLLPRVRPTGAYTRRQARPARTPDEGRFPFATEDIDADHAALQARGVDVDAEVMRMGDPVPPMFFFRDQDGNRLLIVG
jgi:predicted enzyme related to lactoylglutathione lyase